VGGAAIQAAVKPGEAAVDLERAGGELLVRTPVLCAGVRIDREGVVLGRCEQRVVDLHEAGLETGLFACVVPAHVPESFDILRIDRIKRREPLRGEGTVVCWPVPLGSAASERETDECERDYRNNRGGCGHGSSILDEREQFTVDLVRQRGAHSVRGT